MGKDGFLTPKAIANRIKSKGLQKLRWFCQMCQKQCRDENGFKCHLTSESHQRQMLIVAERPDQFVDAFSHEFEQSFLTLLERAHGTKRVSASIVYNEYIQDKMHLHMNATQWRTLTSFIQHLGQQGLCIVEDTPKGWFITYVDRDPEVMHQQKKLEKMDRIERDEEERQADFYKQQYEKDLEAAMARGEALDVEATELRRDDSEQPIKLVLGAAAAARRVGDGGAAAGGDDEEEEKEEEGAQRRSGEKDRGTKRKLSALERIKEMEEQRKQLRQRREEKESERAASHASERGAGGSGGGDTPWICENIVVKVIHPTLSGGRFHKQKGVITGITDGFVATVKMIESSAVIRLDQEYLETVLPALEGTVCVVKGKHRGQLARLVAVDVDNYCATIKLLDGPDKGKTLERMEYESICKVPA